MSAVPFLLVTHAEPPPSFAGFLQTAVVRLLLPMLALEGAFLTFPATALSSSVLQMAHAVILWHSLRPVQPLLLERTHVDKPKAA